MSAPTPPLTLIVAATAKNGIGKNGSLPWPMLKKEMAYFARVTKRLPPALTQSNAVTGGLLSEASSQLSDASNAAAESAQSPQNVVVMGRKTWESIPQKFRPLPARTNVVISRQDSIPGVGSDVVVAKDIVAGLATLNAQAREGKAKPLGRVFVIGGGAIYKAALELASAKNVLLTRVEGDWDCDTDFPVDLDRSSEWVRKSKDDLESFVDEKLESTNIEERVKDTPVRYDFRLYERT